MCPNALPSLLSSLLVPSLLLTLTACGDDLVPSPSDPDGGAGPDAGVPLPALERAQAGGAPTAVELVGDRAYVAIGPRLAIYDLASGGAAPLGESAPLPGVIGAIAVAGDRAYVAERIDLDSRLHVIDVADPSAPVETAVLDFGEGAFSVIRDLATDGDRLFVADQERGVIELDLALPDAPEVVRSATFPGVAGVAPSGDRLYAWGEGFGGLGLVAMDRTAEDLAVIGEGSVPGVQGVAFTGDLLVGAGVDGIAVFDLADPSSPTERFRFTAEQGGPFARAVAAAGTTAWIPAEEGVYVLDLADPLAVTKTGPLDLATAGTNGAAAADGRVAAVTDRGRLIVLDAATPTAPTLHAAVDASLCADCVALAIDGATLHVVDIVGGLRAVGAGDLVEVGRWDAPRPTAETAGTPVVVFEDVAIARDRAYVADWQYGLRVFDVSDLRAPIELDGLDTPGAPSSVAVGGERVYLGESTGGGALRVIDVSESTPAELGAIATSKARDVELAGDLVFVADEQIDGPGGLRVFDVASPSRPREIGYYGTDCLNALDVALLGDLALVACASDGLHVVDVADPTAPTRLAVVPFDAGAAWSVAARGATVALGHDRGVIVLDLSDPRAPVEVERLATPTAVRRVELPEAGRVIAATGLGGVYQWQLD